MHGETNLARVLLVVAVLCSEVEQLLWNAPHIHARSAQTPRGSSRTRCHIIQKGDVGTSMISPRFALPFALACCAQLIPPDPPPITSKS